MNMLWMPKRRFVRRFTFNALKVFLGVCAIVFIIGPVVFRYSYKLQETIIFSYFVNLPRLSNYSYPASIEGLRNFYIESDKDVYLGVWQILPDHLSRNTTIDNDFFDNALNNGQNIIIYYHGNSANRAASHRIELYKILRRRFHLITFDYRSYGDSSVAAPTEENVVRDCIAIYKWVANKTSSKTFVWGHSLGTGLSTHMLSILSTQNIRSTGLILESPFNNMREEISEHPLAKLFRPLPWFHYAVVEPMQANNFIFATDRHILNVDCPILILHAEDDRIVPYKLGSKLYQMAVKYRRPNQGSVEFIGFPKKFGYGHKRIHKAPELLQLIENFVSKAIKEMSSLYPTNTI